VNAERKSIMVSGIGLTTPIGSLSEASYRTGEPIQPKFVQWPAVAKPPNAMSQVSNTTNYSAEEYYSVRQLRNMDKSMVLSCIASSKALEDADVSPATRDLILYTGTSLGEVGSVIKYSDALETHHARAPNPAIFPNIARNISAGQIAIQHKINGPSSHIASGVLASVHALSRGIDDIYLDRADTALCGGFESLSKATLEFTEYKYREYFNGKSPRFFSTKPGVIVPADGSCFVVVERERSRGDRGTGRPYAKIVGHTFGQLGPTERPSSYARKICSFLAGMGAEMKSLAAVFCSQTGGTMPHDLVESEALKLVSDQFPEFKPVCAAPKAIFGESESTAALLSVALAAQALKYGRMLAFHGSDDTTDFKLRLANGSNAELSGDYVLVSNLSSACAFSLILLKKCT
jgi:3-oxoacyl-[acyl-carrier-protein] synthase II